MGPEIYSLNNRWEDFDFEVKAAQGKDGQGEFPGDFLSTYSAMANTFGGIVVLGVKQDGDRLIPLGIANHQKVLKTMWDSLHNKQRVSSCILNDSDVEVRDLGDGRYVLEIHVPRAERSQRPVYLGTNPFGGTFKRNFEGDYRCDDATVRRMIADQVEESRDSKVLENFSIQDLDLESLRAYRQLFALRKPDHIWVSKSDEDFLSAIGAWAKDRQTNISGVTMGGLLMFGKFNSIVEVFPGFFLDYQERETQKTELRWVDRVHPDGSWSGNLFDFYRKVINKLFEGIKVPFQLKGDIRQDDTPVHEALREALVNCLIHADFAGTSSILVIKRPDLYAFRNPGTMRIPLEEAIRGGTSDSRNRKLQAMFRHVGLGEQAGSGVPKIYSAWKSQSWRTPILQERADKPESTILVLRTLSLVPEGILESLCQRFGSERFGELSDLQRLALVNVAVEGEVTHARLKSVVADHPSDITKQLASLVRDGFLDTAGAAKGTRYFFPGQKENALLDASNVESNSQQNLISSQQTGANSQQTTVPNSQQISQDMDKNKQISQGVLTEDAAKNRVEALARPIRDSKKAPRDQVRQVILDICEIDYFSARDLSEILNRDQLTIQNHYIIPLFKEGFLEMKFPEKKQHPSQAYRTAKRK